MRKILIIIGVVLLIVGGIYFFYVRPMVQSGEPVPNVLTPFFPQTTSSGESFGDNESIDPAAEGTAAAGTTNSALKLLAARPVAGYTVFNISNKVSIPSIDPSIKPTVTTVTDNYVRYVSRINGYVYEIKNSDIPLQISNVLIPNIYEAFFADNNNTALLRFLRPDAQTIATYSVPVPPLNDDGTRTQQSGTYLSDNIYSLNVSPDQTKILRIAPEGTGVTVSTSSSTGKTVKSIYKSPFGSWLAQWNTVGIYMQTKAAAIADGFFYSVDQSSSRLKRIVGNVKGLTASASPTGTYVLYSESTTGGFNTKIFNTQTNATTTLNLSILPEKCVWMKNEDVICAGNNTVDTSMYPDAWYAGTTHFTDELYRINPASNTYTVMLNDTSRTFDMVNLQVNEDAHTIYFIDKRTGLLWRYQY